MLGGIIAFYADRLGRYLGKKRLRLLGLRPRHTAAVLTVGAGVLIPLVTVAIVFAASQDVRLWLIEGRQAIEQVKVLRGEVGTLKSQGTELDQQIQSKTTQVAELDAKLQQSLADLKKFRDAAAVSAERARQAGLKVAALTRQAKNLTESLTKQAAALAATTKDLGSAEADLVKARQEYKGLSDAFAILQKEQNDAYVENRRLGMENDQLIRDSERLKQDISGLSADKERLLAEQERLSKDLGDTKGELERGKLELDDLRARLSTASNMLAQNLNASRTMPLTFAMGEELARLSVPNNLTEEAARAALTSLLRSARILADQRGARGDPSCGLWYRETPDRIVTIEEQENAIVKGITGQRDDLVLIASSMLNAFQGEFVALDVKAYRNPIVYQEGQVVAEGRINGQQSEDRVLQQINEFLTGTVRPKALEAKMIPVRGASSPLGEVSQEDVLALMRQILQVSREVRVQALAAQTTRAADSLKLTFRLR
ncbi:MAG: DUF3084 domain-containing protein [Fimbriimonadaceae bacterium]|nr:DUF3084 domain-containing protein [Fimbriimonadaceae bacterium]